jgi:hypothetical protein
MTGKGEPRQTAEVRQRFSPTWRYRNPLAGLAERVDTLLLILAGVFNCHEWGMHITVWVAAGVFSSGGPSSGTTEVDCLPRQ